MEIEEFNKRIVPLRSELLSIAKSMDGATDEAEDAVQETLLRLWRMRSELDKHPHPKALAITIMKNIERDHWRHRQFECEESPLRAEPYTEDAGSNGNDDVELIRLIIDGLPPLQSQIIRMKEIEGYSSEEIMAITGCSADSIRQNLSRARQRIRQEFLRITCSSRTSH
jgi:RNA polymerase sigma factor (sigma-70 family)